MIKTITFIFIALVIFSCGQKRSKTQFNLKVANIVTGTPLPGGVTMRAKSISATGAVASEVNSDFTGSDHIAEVEFGTWDLFFVGFTGPSLWNGSTYCGSVLNRSFSEPEVSLVVNLSAANCGVEPYLSMIASKQVSNISNWDSAIWDTNVWEP